MTQIEGDTNDPVIAALDELSDVVDETAADGRRLKAEIRRVRERRRSGATAREALSGSAPPRLILTLNAMLARLSTASGALRRALVRGLLREGEGLGTAARLFEVSRQRISAVARSHQP